MKGSFQIDTRCTNVQENPRLGSAKSIPHFMYLKLTIPPKNVNRGNTRKHSSRMRTNRGSGLYSSERVP